jgi:truncated hemoglobin YjbI
MRPGFVTENLKNEYIIIHGLDTNKLYFWQLYGIIDESDIHDIITTFYSSVLNDTEDEVFKNTFKNSGTLEHHVKKQTNFWVDAMGGGKRYPGGEARLELHHDNARAIMTRRGAERWLYHMDNALNTHVFKDERVRPCIEEFINFLMYKYGQMYNFNSKL